jgi:hypothetical protein
MWSQESREAFALFMAFAESKVIELFDVVAEFISEYRSYILVGLLILIILVSLDLLMKWQDKREKKKIDSEIEEQMKEKLHKTNQMKVHKEEI